MVAQACQRGVDAGPVLAGVAINPPWQGKNRKEWLKNRAIFDSLMQSISKGVAWQALKILQFFA